METRAVTISIGKPGMIGLDGCGFSSVFVLRSVEIAF